MNFNKYKHLSKKIDIILSSNDYRINLKRLLKNKSKALGRSHGKIVMNHKGGGVKNAYRIIFRPVLNKSAVNYAIIRSLEYDPNRSTFIGLLQDKNGAFFNWPVSDKAKVGQVLQISGVSSLLVKHGDIVSLRNAPIGIPLYNLEKYPNSGPIYSRSAGTYCILLTRDLLYGKVKLPSGEERLFDLDCLTSIGTPSNAFNFLNKKYKAGTNRLLNKRPVVRGTAKNPVDHPHGGGAGKTAPGRPSVSPWGKLTKGVPTRNKKIKNKFIVKSR